MISLLRRLRAWLRALPLQRRVAYLTTAAVALAVAVTSVAGYLTLRISLYRALDAEMVQTATSLAVVPVAEDIRTLGGLTERALRAGNVSVAAIRTDGATFYVPDERDHLVLGAKELAVARLQSGYSARSGVTTGGEEYRIIAVPITDLGNYALVLGRPLQPTNDILSSLWLVLIIFGVAGVIIAAVVGAYVARSSLRPGTRAVCCRRTCDRHQRTDADYYQRDQRHRRLGGVVQRDAGITGLLARSASAADRRCRPRAANAADELADQYRAVGGRCGRAAC
jgi:two-component system sensor histidine kinase MprB